MKEYYTLKEAMKRLGLISINVFRQLERKYTEAFVSVNPNPYARVKKPWYDKEALDKLVALLKSSQEKGQS